jgi:hypothetical protein
MAAVGNEEWRKKGGRAVVEREKEEADLPLQDIIPPGEIPSRCIFTHTHTNTCITHVYMYLCNTYMLRPN